jgi:predicted transcriptional regulator
MTPYRIKFNDPARIITGIACLPKDAKTSSPEVEVVSGGVGCKEVEIVLTPVQKGEWVCVVQINGIAENRLEMNSIPNQLTM